MTDAQESAPDKAVRQLALILFLGSSSRWRSKADVFDVLGRFYQGDDEARSRMFERDKADLRERRLLIDTVTDELTNETLGYRLDLRQSQERELSFTPAQAMYVAIAANMLSEFADSEDVLRAALTAGSLAPGSYGQIVEAAVRVRPIPIAVQALSAAAAERRSVEFLYRKPSQAEPDLRHVQPWTVVAARGHWYLLGFDTERGAQRAYRVDRITGPISRVGEAGAYEVPTNIDVRSLINGPGDDIPEAQVRVRTGTCGRLRARSQSVQSLDAQWDLCTLADQNEPFLARLVAGHGPDARVVSPPSLAAATRAILTAAAGGTDA